MPARILGTKEDTGAVIELLMLKEKEKDIWDTANFGLTWNGFFIKNRENDGWVEISSEEDIAVFKGTSEDAVEKIKIGRLRKAGDKTIYGIKIADDGGNAILVTEDNGELWLKNKIQIGTNDTSTVKIGYLDEVRENTDVHEVIHAGDKDTKFVVYEDGRMEAEGAIFRGEIYATGGQIGNMSIGDVEEAVVASKKAYIVADKGTTFKVDANDIVSPQFLDFRVVTENVSIKNSSQIKWEISSDYINWTPIEGADVISVSYDSFTFLDNIAFLRMTVISDEGETYSDYETIYKVSDGKHPIILTITSTTGGIYINNNIQAELKATVWRNGEDITSKYNKSSFVWTKYDVNGVKDLTWIDYGPIIYIDHTEVEQKATFSCELNED